MNTYVHKYIGILCTHMEITPRYCSETSLELSVYVEEGGMPNHTVRIVSH